MVKLLLTPIQTLKGKHCTERFLSKFCHKMYLHQRISRRCLQFYTKNAHCRNQPLLPGPFYRLQSLLNAASKEAISWKNTISSFKNMEQYGTRISSLSLRRNFSIIIWFLRRAWFRTVSTFKSLRINCFLMNQCTFVIYQYL